MSRDPYCTTVGYVVDSEDEYCAACARDLLVNEGIHKKRLFPIFDKSEFETAPVCSGDGCETALSVTVVD